MLALSLGVAWLLLAPLSLWLLFRGRPLERTGAIVTLLLLEASTIVMGRLTTPHPAPDHAVVAHDAAPPVASCAQRAPTPRSARLGTSLVLTWVAGHHECRTAEVAMRSQGRRLLVWLQTGRPAPAGGARSGPQRLAYTLPVQVKGHTAAVTVPLPKNAARVPVDGRSGRRIPPPRG
ncbi:hypothetical protein Nocox_08260 [Nonomuraea coxensis DSM 45129]|uniref:Integral membrane protein n=1 Tax=Nonomuraea coxensis DSM 45129 TaxID=1122611 RepID=A0ABX8TUY1_9ACTN|nr:hypothetical protein [Nonomuraea coxensis]QYC39277.1 hypothetical protein Nocox_08260 [Nonomuraea coxensis DSM 45129]